MKNTIKATLATSSLLLAIALPASADQVILDDLIVDGSICVGQDCVNGESFGFDTLRLKENNLRIKAQDTSSTSSFPTQDWQITFNDSSNGGQNKFSIDAISPAASTPFTIEAGASSHSLYVDDGGRVGFGTATPVADLHVKNGNTPTLRLEQDGSSGFTPQTWDLAGNEANIFIRDATNGSTLPFRIRPGAPSSTIDIAADGDIGMGTSSPEQDLHIRRSSGGTQILVENTNNGAIQYRLKSDNEIRRIVAKKADDSNQSQIELRDGGHFKFFGSAADAPVCLDFGDSDGAGTTNCTFLDGAMSCATGACP